MSEAIDMAEKAYESSDMKVYVVLAGVEKDEHYEFPEGVVLPCAFNTKKAAEKYIDSNPFSLDSNSLFIEEIDLVGDTEKHPSHGNARS